MQASLYKSIYKLNNRCMFHDDNIWNCCFFLLKCVTQDEIKTDEDLSLNT